MATASEIIYSESTISRYFVIGNIKMRISDHYSTTTDADFQIIIPFNGGNKYTCTVKNSPGKFLSWNAKQIKEFIPALQIMKGLREPINTPRSTKESVVQRVQQALNNTVETSHLTFSGKIIESTLKEKNLTKGQREVFRKDKSTWTLQQMGSLSTLIKEDLKLKSGSGINEDVQIFLTCTSTTYKEILNIYKIIVVDNKEIPTIKLLQEAYSLISQ